MFEYFSRMALKNFVRFKLHTLINVTSLVIGFVCFIMAVTLSSYLDSFDRHFPDAEHTFVLQETRQGASWDSTLPMVGKAPSSYLRTAFPEIRHAVRAVPLAAVDVTADGTTTALNVRYVEGGFFEMFPVGLLKGELSAGALPSNSVLISEAAALKRFGTTKVVGKHILLQHRVDVFVAGVTRTFTAPSHIESAFSALSSDLLVPIEIYDRLQAELAGRDVRGQVDDWFSPIYYTFVQFHPQQQPDLAAFNQKLAQFSQQYVPKNDSTRLTYTIIPVNRLMTATISGVFGGVDVPTVLIVGGFMVLLMAALNYSNLVVAQLSQRSQEIGIQKIFGSTRALLVLQYSYESLLLVAVSLLLAIALCSTVLASLSSATISTALLWDGSLWFGLLLVIAATVAISGAYPALRTTRVSLAALLSTRSGMRASGVLRAVMVGMQFVICSTLIVLSVVMYKQNAKMAQQLDGANADPKIAITTPLNNLSVDVNALAAELQNHPGVVAVSRAGELPWSVGGFASVTLSRSPEPGASQVQVINHIVADGFERAFEVPFLAGRAFEKNRASEEFPDPQQGGAGGPFSIVIDQNTASRLGWSEPAQAIGQQLFAKYKPPTAPRHIAVPLTVIGVTGVQRFQIINFATFGIGGNAYTLQPALAKYLVVRVDRRQLASALRHIDDTWKRFLPQVTMKRTFFDDLFQSSFRTFVGISGAISALAMLGFAVAAIGLLGNATFVIYGRRKEVGIRKVLGASTRRLLAMLIADFAKPVVIANLVAFPIGYFLARAYLSLFPQQATLNAVPFIVALVICVAVTCVAVASQAWKSARVRPAAILRTE